MHCSEFLVTRISAGSVLEFPFFPSTANQFTPIRPQMSASRLESHDGARDRRSPLQSAFVRIDLWSRGILGNCRAYGGSSRSMPWLRTFPTLGFAGWIWSVVSGYGRSSWVGGRSVSPRSSH